MSWWQKAPVFYKILGAFLLAVFVFAVFDIYLVVSLNQIRSMSLEVQDHYRILNELSVLSHDNDALSDAVKSYIITKDNSWRVKYDATLTDIDTVFSELNAETSLSRFDQITLNGLQASLKSIQGLELQVFSRVAAGDVTGASDLFQTSYQSKQQAITNAINTVVANRNYEVLTLIEDNNATLANLRSAVAVLFGVFILVFAVMWFGLSKGLVGPLEDLTGIANKIGAGDLEAPINVDGEDEVGQLAAALRNMRAKVTEAYMNMQRDQAQLIASINSLPVGFIMLDIHGSGIVSNRAAQDLFRLQRITISDIAQQFGKPFDVTNVFRHVLATKEDEVIQDLPINGMFFRALIVPILLPNARREVIGAVFLFEDVTNQKNLEQSKGSFVAIASHEMRTPLAIIRGNAELMLDDPAIKNSPDASAQIQSILKSTVRLLGIVNDFLDIQNLEQDHIILKIEPVDFVKALKETIADMSQLAERKKLYIVFDEQAAPPIPILQLDKYRLQQIFMNLISNGIHYTDEGGVTLTVTQDGDTVKLLVKDTGIGMELEDQGRLFKKFETGKTFLRSKEYGSGMGLYISRILARLMGGDLWLVSSEFGGGSTFGFTIPLSATMAKDGVTTAEMKV
ncbi:MAG TPA: ATP-binding protein [Candidatus Paceibacterota bacterium]|nr:ATP-binding protein [Candidatus Paceibacterota bacterium]